MVPVRHEDGPIITCMCAASTLAVMYYGPDQSSGSHHEVTWLGLGPLDVSPVYHEGGSGTTPVALRTRRGGHNPPSMHGSGLARRGFWQKGLTQNQN